MLVPDAELTDNQVVLAFALQFKVPPPVLLMVTVCAKGLLPPCWAEKDRLVGLAPIAGLTETTGAEGEDSNCVSAGISAANLFIDRPPVFPFPEVEELPVPAAASGIVSVDTVPAAVTPEVVTEVGATLMVARGTVGSARLVNHEGSLD
jgi:hypothetical protein